MTDTSHLSQQSILSSSWFLPTAATLTTAAAILAIHARTFGSMVDIWSRSDTYTHGYLVIPIVLFLIWREREHLAAVPVRSNLWSLAGMALLGLGWLAASAANILVGQQLSLMAMLPMVVFGLLGWRMTQAIAFPLGFLVMAVPMGESLIPRLMDFTADFTVGAIKLTGIPVYREGTFFTLPSGDWSVVEACSGLRYLIASVTLGFLYAYLTFRSIWRRLIFAVVAIALPIVANGMRAFMIVMIAHFSDMKLALGVDHFIYGWIFFGLVMLLMFWVGSFWAENAEAPNPPLAESLAAPAARVQSLGLYAMGLLAVAAFFPLWAARVEQLEASRTAPISLVAPVPAAGWTLLAEPFTDWQPRYIGSGALLQAQYQSGEQRVGLTIPYFRQQGQNAELINSQNVLIPQKHPVWKMPSEVPASVRLAGRQVEVLEGSLMSSRQKLLVWRWNWVAGQFTADEYLAKLLEAGTRLLGRVQDGAAIVVYTEMGDTTAEANRTLQKFVDDMLPSIEATLRAAAASQP